MVGEIGKVTKGKRILPLIEKLYFKNRVIPVSMDGGVRGERVHGEDVRQEVCMSVERNLKDPG